MSYFLPRAAVLLLAGVSAVNGQPVVGGVFRIGELPPRFTVYQDQSLQLTIVSPVANGVLSLQFSATPKGTTTFSTTTGIFTYQPSQEDKAEFAVTFKATPPTGSTASQTIFITPLPFLRPDRDFIQNRRAPPDETSGVYLKYTDSVSPADKSRSAEISGRTVTLQAGGREFGLINYVPPGAGAPVNGEVRDLKIYAETVIIRSPLFLPSCNVTIWAQELRFEDAPNTLAADRARLDTTPIDRDQAIGKPPDATKDGVAGLNGGSVTLHIGRFASIPSSTTTNGIIGPVILNIIRIRAVGGNGQQAGQGLPGATPPNPDLRPYIAPNPYPAGSHTETYKCGLFNLFDCDVVCSWNPFTTNSTIYIDVYCNGAYRYVWGIGGVWPGDGGDATPGGHPGGGGNGGNIGTTVDLVPSYANYAGSSGAYANVASGGAAGLPAFAQRQHLSSTGSYEVHYSKRGNDAYGPGPLTFGSAGGYTVAAEPSYSWLHPYAGRAILNYAKDAFRDGNLELARSIVAAYLPAFQQRSQDASVPEWFNDFRQYSLEAEQMLARLDANLDYYGNPAGWAPLLSLQANMTLLSNEVTAAVPTLYLSFWMEKYAADAQKNAEAITAARNALWKETTDAQKAYADAITTIPKLQTQAADIQNQIASAQIAIGQLEQALLHRADLNVQERNRVPFWKSACRILAGICKVIPVYQPALAAIGTGLDFVTNVDPNKPLDSYNQGLDIAKQFNSQLFSDSSAQLNAELAKLSPNGQSASEYAKSVTGVYNKWAGALDQIRQSLQPAAAPKNEVEAELKKIEAEDPAFQNITKLINDLNLQKAALVKSIADLSESMAKASQTASANLLTLAELDRTLGKTIKTMDHKTVVQVREMGRRAEERLQKYLYYMAKAFEYSMVMPYPGDLRLDAVESQIRTMLADAFTQDPKKFDLILEPYRQAIRDVIKTGVDKAQLKARPQQLPILFSLSAQELQALNINNEVTIDLTDRVRLLGREEEKRIVDLRIDDAGISVSPSNSNTQLFVGMQVIGDSVLSTTYTIDTSRQYSYAFRFGTPSNPDPFTWTDSYLPSTNNLKHNQEDLGSLTLLKTFLTGPNGTALPFTDSDLAPFFFARPSAESTLRISRSPGASITSLRFNLTMSYIPNSGSYSVLSVKPADTGSPVIGLSLTDATGRSKGQGEFRRLYTSGRSVTLTAETTIGHGALAFREWVDDNGNQLSTSPSLTLNVNGTRIVKPNYVLAAPLVTGFQVSGTVSDGSNNCASGVTMTLTGTASATNVTASNGTYSFGGLPTGPYTITPTKAGCTFAPVNRAFTVTADRTGENFTGTPAGQGPAVTILAPSENQVVAVTNVTFNWTQDASAVGYAVTVQLSGSGQTVFSGQLAGAGSTSTVLNLPAGNFSALVKSCRGAGFTNCATSTARNFSVQPPFPALSPQIVFPTNGSTLLTSTQNLVWTGVTGATTYQVTLRNNTAGTVDLFISTIAPTVNTIFSMRSGAYTMEVRACSVACGAPGTVNFNVTLPAVPSAAPVISGCNITNVSGQNSVTCSWSAVARADLYIIQVVQPGSGPGGGALTVASTQVSATTATFLIPNGAAVVFVQACNGDGCGPNGQGPALNPAFNNPNVPVLGSPAGGVTVIGPTVLFSWSRIPGDNGSNTTYRLYVQDFARSQPALDILTTQNYWGAMFAAGRRYDALVIANPGGPSPAQGPAQAFITRGNNPFAPTLVQPQHQGRTQQGNVKLGWTPLPGAQLYQYYIAQQGKPDPVATGVTTGIEVQVPLNTLNGLDTIHTGIVRSCANGTNCNANSDTGWAGWSNTPGGTGVTTFTITP